MSGPRKPADVLAESRRRDSRTKRQRVLATVDQMLAQGEPVTFAAVARTAGVSNWLVYADGVREHIEQARAQQASRPAHERLTRATTSSASIRTDLELARAEIQALREERDHLKGIVQRGLGQQLEQVASKDLITRVDELTTHNHDLTARLDQVQAENNDLQRRLREAEDDVAAARSNLRRMIRSGVHAGTT
jgi:predicted RNase H-like nuclease (RuvC/YqgF family)